MIFKNTFRLSKPPIADKLPLAERLRAEKDLAALSALVREKNIGIVTVHPFFARYLNDTTHYLHADMLKQEYYDYEKDMVSFLKDNMSGRRAFHIFENTTRSIESAGNAFAEHGSFFACQEEPFYSPDGKIFDMASEIVLEQCEKVLTLDGIEAMKAIRRNLGSMALPRLVDFIKEKNGLLLIGIFENFCLKRARTDIEL
ncbi:MAG TPA: hypothetical protein PLO51_05335, partial [Candidatus Micrarchaeota archaeon]|nr:hypothetical protein [Candidatus Micrarchaeota archaeon]